MLLLLLLYLKVYYICASVVFSAGECQSVVFSVVVVVVVVLTITHVFVARCCCYSCYHCCISYTRLCGMLTAPASFQRQKLATTNPTQPHANSQQLAAGSHQLCARQQKTTVA